MYQTLEQHGLFSFENALRALEGYELDDESREIRLLGAAELAAATKTERPVVVDEPHMWWSLRYYQCSLGDRPNCGKLEPAWELWDVTIFAGHMKKLALLGYRDVPHLHEHFDEAYAAIRDYYLSYEPGDSLVYHGHLALQAATWLARLEIFERSPDPEARLGQFIEAIVGAAASHRLAQDSPGLLET